MIRTFIACILLTCCSGYCLAQSTPDQEVTMCTGDTATMSATVINADSLQWFRNDAPLAGGNGDTLVYPGGGLFYLRAYSSGGQCMDQSGDIKVFIAYPRTYDDRVAVPLGQLTSFNVLDNDIAACAPFDLNSFTIVSPPAIGKLISFEGGNITYRPSPTLIGSDQFTYRIRDMEGRMTNESTVYLEITLDCAILYPNPVDHILNITVNNKRIHTIKIRDMAGRELYRTVVNGPILKVDMNDYAQGMYIVELIEHDGPGCTLKIQKR